MLFDNPQRFLYAASMMQQSTSSIQGTASSALHRLPLVFVAQRCQQQSQRFLQGKSHDSTFCYELFRRAFAEDNERAWSLLYAQYTDRTPLVRSWVQEHSAFVASGESVDYFANRAFEKMWSALRRRDFADFPHLRSLLSYLKLCVNSVITDHVRAVRPNQVDWQETQIADVDVAAQQLTEMGRVELWQEIEARLRSDKERIATYCRYDEGMKPQEILAAYPEEFQSVDEIYRTLQNVLARLRRDALLREFYEGAETETG